MLFYHPSVIVVSSRSGKDSGGKKTRGLAAQTRIVLLPPVPVPHAASCRLLVLCRPPSDHNHAVGCGRNRYLLQGTIVNRTKYCW